MSSIQHLLTEHLDIWTAADTAAKSGRGRSAANAAKVYGISKLRELILELAVRGKLVPQDPNDEPASELLKRIQAEKTKLIAEGKIKKDKPLPPITNQEIAFESPAGWRWARFGEIASYIQRGKGPVYDDTSDIPVISQKCVRWTGLDISQARYIDPASLSKYEEIRILCEGDILWNSTGTGTIGRACVVPKIQGNKFLVVDSHVTIVRYIELSSYFMWRWIQSPFVQIGIEGSASGSTNQIELNTSTVISHPAPIPPLAEQHRIVAKVDELMALCDQLESEHNNASAAHEQLVNHLLGALTESTSAEDFSAGWQRIAAHFDTLFTTEASIDTLKQTLLQLAVMGKLVPQDPNDEPASELLKNIRKEKDQLIAEGKIKKDKPLPPITDEERPFALPSGWEWVRLSVFSELKGGMAYQSHSFSESGLNQVIRMGNVRPGKLRLDEKPVYISESLASNTTDYMLDIDDIVLTMTGTIGKRDYLYSARICSTHLNNKKLFLNQRLCSVKNFLMNVSYVNMAMKSDKLLDVIFASATGTANQANIGMLALCSWPIPVPSLAEQHRIVAKVDELMALCDQLKSQLLESGEQQRKLADVLVKNAVA